MYDLDLVLLVENMDFPFLRFAFDLYWAKTSHDNSKMNFDTNFFDLCILNVARYSQAQILDSVNKWIFIKSFLCFVSQFPLHKIRNSTLTQLVIIVSYEWRLNIFNWIGDVSKDFGFWIFGKIYLYLLMSQWNLKHHHIECEFRRNISSLHIESLLIVISFSSIDKYPDNESRTMINRFVFSCEK